MNLFLNKYVLFIVHFHDFHDNPFIAKCSIRVSNKGLFALKKYRMG